MTRRSSKPLVERSSKPVVPRVSEIYQSAYISHAHGEPSLYIPRDHGACTPLLWDQEVYPQSTLLRRNDPGILLGEIAREPLYRYSRSGKSLLTTHLLVHQSTRQLSGLDIVMCGTARLTKPRRSNSFDTTISYPLPRLSTL